MVVRQLDPVATPGPVPGGPLAVPRVALGDLLAETFRVKRIIEGGMGTVYVCDHTVPMSTLQPVTPATRDRLVRDRPSPERSH